MVRAIGKKDKSYVSFQVHTEDEAMAMINTFEDYFFKRLSLASYLMTKISMSLAYRMAE